MNALSDRLTERIQTLEAALLNPVSRADEIDSLAGLAWELRMHQPERAIELGQKAAGLSQSGEFLLQPYAQGLAAGLVAQAFVEAYTAKLDTSVSRCLEALKLLEVGLLCAVQIRIWYTLSWNSFFLGDFAAAMENGLKTLRFSQELGDELLEAWALDGIGSFHGATGDFPQALEAARSSVKLFRQLGDALGELRALNNLAYTLSLMGDNPSALLEIQQAIQAAQRQGLDGELVALGCTAAQILVHLGCFEQAEAHLQDSLAGLAVHGMTVSIIHVALLMEFGRLHRLQNQIEPAQEYFLKALQQAQTNHQLAELALCHQALSEIYEEQGQLAQALQHYKAFHTHHEAALVQRRISCCTPPEKPFVELVEPDTLLPNPILPTSSPRTYSTSYLGEQAAQRLMVFKIIYQVESAQHEAEIYRLQTVQLQTTVDQQKLIQETLEKHNGEDGLTGIANRRHLDETLRREYERLARSDGQLSLILLDVDCFKAFNDTYGHVSGDDCLRIVAQLIKSTTHRPLDLVARYGGEEFACVLPETNLEGAKVIAEKIRQGLVNLAIPHAGSTVSNVVTASFGVATARCEPAGLVQDIVAKADAQLYAAKQNGRNCVMAVALT